MGERVRVRAVEFIATNQPSSAPPAGGGTFSPIGEKGTFANYKLLKYSIAFISPCSSWTLGSQVNFSFASEISGWRCFGSS